ncbi:serine/threonine-protein kinase [Fimbriiglobus ruber]|uniref:Putative serine/threonine-protein kinase pknB n=1 Tax=Fimbriiglobus ruber TaxID=1908690 RepID=A0A225DFZ8_9BACT|nr:serine/threonine-protein kinase [Fimbriiglobus ruber]OWK40412.1 putative serine/threonine-protein kinase pknB [Fimbriiglobus ruber]
MATAATIPCLTLDAFRQLADTAAAPDDVRRWAAHVAECPKCVLAVRSLRAEASVLSSVESVLGRREPLLASLQSALHEREDDTPCAADRLAAPNPTRPLSATIPFLPGATDRSIGLSPDDQTLTRASARTVADIDLPVLTLVPANQSTGLRPAQSPDEIGRIGPYRILKKLGVGSVGVVFQAEDVYLRRMVALKIMPPTSANDPEVRRHFIQQGQAIAALNHPNVVPVYQVVEDNGVPFLATQFLRGETLNARLKRGARLNLYDAVQIAKQVATGLAAIHDHGFTHRDLKPANIWLEESDGGVKLLEFGLIRTDGTSGFTSPEQASGGAIDHRADLYSLGCVIHALFTGVAPFPALDEKPTFGPARKLVAENPRMPLPLAGLVDLLLVRHPNGRPGSIRDVLTVLESVEKQLPKMKRPRSRKGWVSVAPPKPTSGKMRQRIRTGLVGLGILIVTMIAAQIVAPKATKWVQEASRLLTPK